MMNKQAFIFSGVFIVIVLAVVVSQHFSGSFSDIIKSVAVVIMNVFR